MKIFGRQKHIRGLVLSFLGLGYSHAQVVIAPSPNAIPPLYNPGRSQGTTTPILSNINSVLRLGTPPFKRGDFSVRPHFLYRIMYAEGLLNAGQTEPGSSIVQSFTAGALVILGRHWDLDYSFTKTINSNNFIADSSDQALTLSGEYSWNEWAFGVSEAYSLGSPTLVETGAQTRQKSYATQVHGGRELGQRTFFSISLNYNVRLSNAPATAPEWSTANWRSWAGTGSLRYRISRELEFSGTDTIGYDDISTGSDMSYNRPQAEVTWHPADKLSMNASVGMEYRRFETTGTGSLSTPVYSAGLQYHPLTTTTISLNGSRSVSASYFANQATKNTVVGLSLEQRILRRFFWSGDVSQSQTSYISPENFVPTRRTDRSTLFGSRLSTVLAGRLSLSVFYQQAHNSSNTAGFRFTSHQFGGEAGYQF